MLKSLLIGTSALLSILVLYCVLVSPAHSMESSAECLAKNMYYEARNQGTAGWLAVTGVVLNRVNDRRFPNNICDVITQGPSRPS